MLPARRNYSSLAKVLFLSPAKTENLDGSMY